jgi:hypothetical protein
LAYHAARHCEWDPEKSAANHLKQGIGLEEAAHRFDLPPHLILEEYDLDHSGDEERIRSTGPIERGVILVVSTEREDGEVVRLVSARLATPSERWRYAGMIAGDLP